MAVSEQGGSCEQKIQQYFKLLWIHLSSPGGDINEMVDRTKQLKAAERKTKDATRNKKREHVEKLFLF